MHFPYSTIKNLNKKAIRQLIPDCFFDGYGVNARDIKKHRLDVFRLFQLVRENQRIPVPQSIMEDITRFIAQMRQEDIRLTDIGIRRSKDSILDIYSQMYITE